MNCFICMHLYILLEKMNFFNDVPFLVYDFPLFQMRRFTIKYPITRSLLRTLCLLPPQRTFRVNPPTNW